MTVLHNLKLLERIRFLDHVTLVRFSRLFQGCKGRVDIQNHLLLECVIHNCPPWNRYANRTEPRWSVNAVDDEFKLAPGETREVKINVQPPNDLC